MGKIWIIILGAVLMGGMIGIDFIVSKWTKPKKEEDSENKENYSE